MSVRVGFSKTTIHFPYINVAFMGYGKWNNRGKSQSTPLHVRSCVIKLNSKVLVFSNVEMAFIIPGIHREVLAKLKGTAVNRHNLMLTAQHTHSAPSGFSEYSFYSFSTPKFRPKIQKAYVEAIVKSVLEAFDKLEPATLILKEGEFNPKDNIAWNRSLKAYNNNPEVKNKVKDPRFAIDNKVRVLQVLSDNNKILGSVNWLGVHATCIGNDNTAVSYDNKGYAAQLLEEEYPDTVHIFAQGKAGDISPHFHGKNEQIVRAKVRIQNDHFYALRNGRKQFEVVKGIMENSKGVHLSEKINSLLFFSDFTAIDVFPKYTAGVDKQRTSDACFGVPFFVGTRVDGKGVQAMGGFLLSRINSMVNPVDKPDVNSQGNKDIILNASTKQMLGKNRMDVLPNFVDKSVAEMNLQFRAGALEENTLVPTVLPVQLFLIGEVILLGVPGEITTIAGVRLEETVLKLTQQYGVKKVVVSSYANSYMGYITTKEEYEVGEYESGHTLFGQWTLAAFQTQFERLVHAIFSKETTGIDFDLFPPLFSKEELDLRKLD